MLVHHESWGVLWRVFFRDVCEALAEEMWIVDVLRLRGLSPVFNMPVREKLAHPRSHTTLVCLTLSGVHRPTTGL